MPRDRREYHKAWRAANRERLNAYTREYRRKYRLANPGKGREAKRAKDARYRERHREEMNERIRLARKTPEGRAKKKICEARWRSGTSPAAVKYQAKLLLTRDTGIPIAKLPEPLVEAKAAYLRALREIRQVTK